MKCRVLLYSCVLLEGMVLASAFGNLEPANITVARIKSAKTLTEALPRPVRYATAEINATVLIGPRRIPIDGSSKVAVDHVLRWINRTISPTWRPAKPAVLRASLVMIRGEDKTPDIVRTTWSKDDYEIEVSQTLTVMVIKITPKAGTDMGKTLDEKIAYARNICSQVFADRDKRQSVGKTVPVTQIVAKVCKYSFRPDLVRELSDGIVGMPITRQQAGVVRPRRPASETIAAMARADNPTWDRSFLSWSYWWRHVAWWHDGASVGFFFPKYEAGPMAFDVNSTGPLRWIETNPVNVHMIGTSRRRSLSPRVAPSSTTRPAATSPAATTRPAGE